MTSALRKRIAGKIVSSIQAILDRNEVPDFRRVLPTALRLVHPKNDTSKFVLLWKDLIELKPKLESRLQPQSLHSLLKNQDFLPREGITDITFKENNQTSFIFSLDQETFIHSVMRSTFNNIEDIFARSCFSNVVTPQRIVIDYSSPNMAKPFHFGHFRSTIVGNFFANLFRYVGHDVVSINYVGDWGLQYGILATAYNSFGSEEKLQQDALKHLYEVYQEGNRRIDEDPNFAEEAKKHFKKMEEGDPASLQQWNKFRDYTLKNLTEVYEKLGIKFDEIHGESMYANDCNNVFASLMDKNIATLESDGSIQATIAEDEFEEKVVLRKSDNTTLYLTRDLAAAIDRQNKYNFHSMYYVVDSSQRKHFNNLFHLLKQMGYSWHSNLFHVPFGRVLNFSTRKGSAVFLQDILSEAEDRIIEQMKKSPNTKVTGVDVTKAASILGISALIVNDLAVHRKRDYPFLWDTILRMDGDSGISLQYCHARLNNIKENCGVELHPECDLSPLVEPEAIGLVHQISRFDEAIWHSYRDLEPHVLVHYLFQLKKAANKANRVLTVKGQPMNIAAARLMMFQTARLVLCQGLKILGIQPLNKM